MGRENSGGCSVVALRAMPDESVLREWLTADFRLLNVDG